MTIPLILMLIPAAFICYGDTQIDREMTLGFPNKVFHPWLVILACTLAYDLYRVYRRQGMRRPDGSGYDGYHDGGGHDGDGHDGHDGGCDSGGNDGDGGGDCGGGGGE